MIARKSLLLTATVIALAFDGFVAKARAMLG